MQESKGFGVWGGEQDAELGNNSEDIGHTKIWTQTSIAW